MLDGAKLLLGNFESFARMAFRDENGGQKLGDEPYIAYVCRQLARVKNDGARYVVNMPPRHLKTCLGAVYLAAWLLARKPAEKIIIVTYSEPLAGDSAYRLRAILQSPWYKKFFPRTRLAEDRTRVADFATTAGGGVYAVSTEGSITGRGASVIIFDDPLNIIDAGNLDQIAKVNQRFGPVIMSRLNNPKTGRVVIIAHRLHPFDLSGHVLGSGGWDHIALPFMAPRDQDYDLGTRIWHRKKGELLRPDAFSEAEINRIKTTINPDYEALYQQYLGEGDSIRITREQFGSFFVAPDAPVVISVDPGHRPGPEHCFTVMQGWSPVGNEFFLRDQWRKQADIGEASRALNKATANCQAAAVLIEWSGYGQTLFENLRRHFRSLNHHLIAPDGRSKTARLLPHIDVIQSGRIRLPQDARWREAYACEFEQFPHGPFDDQVDATTQFLDFMLTSPALEKPPERCLGVAANRSGVVTSANQAARLGRWPGYSGLDRRSRVRHIFPAQEN
jgi:predicted phage terminase large subunit-like protein